MSCSQDAQPTGMSGITQLLGLYHIQLHPLVNLSNELHHCNRVEPLLREHRVMQGGREDCSCHIHGPVMTKLYFSNTIISCVTHHRDVTMDGGILTTNDFPICCTETLNELVFLFFQASNIISTIHWFG